MESDGLPSMHTSRRRFLAVMPTVLFAACTSSGRGRSAAGTTAPGPITAPARPATTAPSVPTSVPTSVRSPAGGAARFIRQGPGSPPVIAFTFHGNGDVGLLDQLLAVAAAHHAPITIFAVGRWLDDNPGVAQHVLGAGHELANHTYTHPSLGRLGPAEVASEITKARDSLVRHAGSPGKWFRPSGVEVPGATILDAAGAAGYGTVVGYDVDPHDYQDPGAAAVRSRTAAGAHAGAIVSLHTGHRGTVDALSGILDDAAAKGLRPVTVSELLQA